MNKIIYDDSIYMLIHYVFIGSENLFLLKRNHNYYVMVNYNSNEETCDDIVEYISYDEARFHYLLTLESLYEEHILRVNWD